MASLEYPKWAPPAAVWAGSQMLAVHKPPIETAVIRRLLIDERMKAVWSYLGNPKKCSPSPAALRHLRDHPVVKGLSDQDVVLAFFLFWSCMYAHYSFATVTTASLVKRREPYLRSAKRLQDEAQLLRERWSKDPEAEAHAAAIDAVISFHKNKTKQLFKPPPRLVDRDQGEPHQRAYAVYMANAAHYLFGEHMYGTIATVTNVALVTGNKKQVLLSNVRDWCKASKG